MSDNITVHNFQIELEDKLRLTKSTPIVLWLYGLSGTGKSTIANELEKILHKNEKITRILDGDGLRSGLNSDLKFSQNDREENLRRVAETSKLFIETGITTICCFITPLQIQRQKIKEILKENVKFIHVETSLETCEKRDPKGLYKKARSGEIKNFTGIDSKFEPSDYDLVVNTDELSPVECARKVIDHFNLL